MKTTGIAYGFLLSDKDKSALEQALEEGRKAMGITSTLTFTLVPLTPNTNFSSSNGEFRHHIQRATKGRMNYVAEARLRDADNHITARRLAMLFEFVLGHHDQGVLYLDKDHHYHYLQDKIVQPLEALV